MKGVTITAEKLRAELPGAKISIMSLDLASLTSVREFAAAFLATGKPLNVLLQVGRTTHHPRFESPLSPLTVAERPCMCGRAPKC